MLRTCIKRCSVGTLGRLWGPIGDGDDDGGDCARRWSVARKPDKRSRCMFTADVELDKTPKLDAAMLLVIEVLLM